MDASTSGAPEAVGGGCRATVPAAAILFAPGHI